MAQQPQYQPKPVEQSPIENEQAAGVAIVIVLATIFMLVMVVRKIQEDRKPKTLGDRIARTYHEGREVTEAAIDNLEREVKKLRREMDDKLRQFQR